ncbi:MAG: hypothetical protein JWN27_2962 [Candidatus Eremiobacteraeota bacterium]|nr:hypothetical protein [Candidatus Eremiobacteraeota bacterium]
MKGQSAWLLLVVSSEAQTESIDDYRRMAREDAAKNGWAIEREFAGASSGKDGPRALLMQMTAELELTIAASRPAWVWMRRVDRVGRGRIAESTLAMHRIADLGVRIWDHDAGEVKLDTAANQLIASFRSGMAAMENEVRRGKAVAVYAKRRAAGAVIGNKMPYGLALGPDRKYIVQEPQAEAVRAAFRMAAAGQGCVQIARELEKIAPPHRYANGRAHAVRWTDSRVSRMLRARAYVGPVIDELTFLRAERARAAVTHASSGRRWTWPLATSLRCFCGRSMSGIASGPEGRRIRYYYCRARWNHDGRLRMVRAESLEEQFLALLRKYGASPALVERKRRAAEPTSPKMLERSLTTTRARLATVERKRASVLDLYTDGKVRAEDVQGRLDAYSAERAELAERITELEAQRALLADGKRAAVDASDLFRESAEIFADVDEAAQRAMARGFAIAFGGLCADEDGRLVPRRVEDRAPQRRRRAGEI